MTIGDLYNYPCNRLKNPINSRKIRASDEALKSYKKGLEPYSYRREIFKQNYHFYRLDKSLMQKSMKFTGLSDAFCQKHGTAYYAMGLGALINDDYLAFLFRHFEAFKRYEITHGELFDFIILQQEGMKRYFNHSDTLEFLRRETTFTSLKAFLICARMHAYGFAYATFMAQDEDKFTEKYFERLSDTLGFLRANYTQIAQDFNEMFVEAKCKNTGFKLAKKWLKEGLFKPQIKPNEPLDLNAASSKDLENLETSNAPLSHQIKELKVEFFASSLKSGLNSNSGANSNSNLDSNSSFQSPF